MPATASSLFFRTLPHSSKDLAYIQGAYPIEFTQM